MSQEGNNLGRETSSLQEEEEEVVMIDTTKNGRELEDSQAMLRDRQPTPGCYLI